MKKVFQRVFSSFLRCSFSRKTSHGLLFYHLTVLRHFYKVFQNNRYLILRCRVFSFFI